MEIKELSISDIPFWDDLVKKSATGSFFQTKKWLEIWLKHFPLITHIFGFYENNTCVGIAPLCEVENTIQFLGTAPVLGGEFVSDFGDIIVLPGHEKPVWSVLVSYLQKISRGKEFVGKFIREESPSFSALSSLGGNMIQSDVSPYIDLPASWDEYLTGLERHSRHELKRKIRRLEEQGAFKVCHEGDPTDKDEFFRLMAISNDQKRDFLSESMKKYFTDILDTFWTEKSLYLCFLKLEGKNIACVVMFSYNEEILLYNSGYDIEFRHLAPGLLLKAFNIKHSIEEKRKRFDFLRGAERYKFDLGGKERKLYNVILPLS